MDLADRRMLKDLFDQVDVLKGRRILRRKAFSCAACMASVLYATADDQATALARILESLVLWPFRYEREHLKTPTDRLKVLGIILLRMLGLKAPHPQLTAMSEEQGRA